MRFAFADAGQICQYAPHVCANQSWYFLFIYPNSEGWKLQLNCNIIHIFLLFYFCVYML